MEEINVIQKTKDDLKNEKLCKVINVLQMIYIKINVIKIFNFISNKLIMK